MPLFSGVSDIPFAGRKVKTQTFGVTIIRQKTMIRERKVLREEAGDVDPMIEF